MILKPTSKIITLYQPGWLNGKSARLETARSRVRVLLKPRLNLYTVYLKKRLKQAKLQLYISLDGSMVRSFDLKSQGCEFEPHPGHSPCICIAHFLVVELVTRIGLALCLALRGVRVPVA